MNTRDDYEERRFEEFIGVFPDFTTSQIYELIGHEPTCLADFIQAWVRSGQGVEACRSYRGLLVALALAVAQWSEDQGVTDYFDSELDQFTTHRRMPYIFGPAGTNHPILDPRFFAACMQEYQQRQRAGAAVLQPVHHRQQRENQQSRRRRRRRS